MVSLEPHTQELPAVIGRYALYDQIAAGGMATVHFGRLHGPVGFSRLVAVKRLHPEFSRDREFVSMFIDEARHAARVRHPNVVQTLNVVDTEGELFVVMEYVQGESLARLLQAARTAGPVPIPIACAIMCGVLNGLHAAHEATDTDGEPLGLVHRDVSPQNVLVGVDGIPRVLDFGIALVTSRKRTTGDGKLKGKFGYMAPEHIDGHACRQSDVFATGIVLWEVLTGKRLFGGDDAKTGLPQDQDVGDYAAEQSRRAAPPRGWITWLCEASSVTSQGATPRRARWRATSKRACGWRRFPRWVSGSSRWRTLRSRSARRPSPIESSPSGITDLSQLPAITTVTGPRSSARPTDATLPNGSHAPVNIPLVPPVAPDGPVPHGVGPLHSRMPHLGLVLFGAASLFVGTGIVIASNYSRPASSPAPAPVVSSTTVSKASEATSSEPLPSATVAVGTQPVSSAKKPQEASTAVRVFVAPSGFIPSKRLETGSDCDPPYSLDAEGHKHLEHQCF